METKATLVETMTYINSITIRLENKTLPKNLWTHNAHFAVAFSYLDRYQTIKQTILKLRESIKAYNISVGTENTENSGYHETLTIFWLTVVYEFYGFKKHNNIDETYEQFIQTVFAKSAFPLKFYTEELLFSTIARQSWLEPNLLPLFTIKKLIQDNSSEK